MENINRELRILNQELLKKKKKIAYQNFDFKKTLIQKYSLWKNYPKPI